MYANYLMHHGIKGMKWGIRRYQNEDGTWTEAGKKRRQDEKAADRKKYVNADGSLTKAGQKEYDRINEVYKKNLKDWEANADRVDDRINELAASDESVKKIISEHTGDGTELVNKILAKTGDTELSRRIDDADELWELIEMERNDALAKLRHADFSSSDYLMHWGIKGMKWGIRRYQNEDGSLTPAGIKRYRTVENFERARASKEGAKAVSKEVSAEDRAAEIQRQKEAAIAKGDAKKILELRGEMTTAEIKDAYDRLNTLSNINKLIPPEKTRSEKIKEFMATAQATIKTINDYNKAKAEKWKAKAAKEDALLKKLNYKDEKKQKKKEAKEEKKEKKSEKKQEKQEKQEQKKQEQKQETKLPESKPTETPKVPSMFDRVSKLNETTTALNSKSRSEIAGPLQKRDSSVDKIWSGIGKTPSSGSPLRTRVSDLLSNPVYNKDRFSSVQTLVNKANAKNGRSSMLGAQPIRSLDKYESTYVGKKQFSRLFG